MNSFSLKKIGAISNLQKIAQEMDQFLSGVFLAIRKDTLVKNKILLGTEDSEFRQLEIDGVIIEIRAFDTAYFEIYSDDYTLIKSISDHYHMEIQKSLYQ